MADTEAEVIAKADLVCSIQRAHATYISSHLPEWVFIMEDLRNRLAAK